MSPSNLAPKSVAASPRVLRVGRSAIQRLAWEVLAVRLTDAEAESLALHGDLEASIRELETRLRVLRPGLARPERVSLAVQEISLRRVGEDETEIRKVVQHTVRKALDRQAQDRRSSDETRRLDDLLAEYEHRSPQMRSFIRRVTLIWGRRRHMLQTIIEDEWLQEKALGELDALLERHVQAACGLVDQRRS